jgi:hypothetical protein
MRRVGQDPGARAGHPDHPRVLSFISELRDGSSDEALAGQLLVGSRRGARWHDLRLPIVRPTAELPADRGGHRSRTDQCHWIDGRIRPHQTRLLEDHYGVWQLMSPMWRVPPPPRLGSTPTPQHPPPRAAIWGAFA